VIDELLQHDERSSREVWDHVRKRGIKISRASVINFLDRLGRMDLASYREESCKGGSRRIYKVIDRTWDDFNNTIIDKILFKLWEIFPDNERIKQAMAK